MRKIVFFTLLLLVALPILGNNKTKDEVVFFAKVETSSPECYAEDSLLVNVVLYASLPFEEVKRTGKALTARGGVARLLPRYYPARQQRLRDEQGQWRYVLLAEQYMVHAQEVGQVQLSASSYEAQLGIYEETYDFFGWPTQVLRSTIQKKTALKTYSIPVKARPKPSTRQLLQQRTNVT